MRFLHHGADSLRFAVTARTFCIQIHVPKVRLDAKFYLIMLMGNLSGTYRRKQNASIKAPYFSINSLGVDFGM
jgi:hypothetical protein